MAQEISVDELAAALEHRRVMLIDIRDAERFAVGHIPGSWSVALALLPGRLRDPDDELWDRLFGPDRASAGVSLVCDGDEDGAHASAILAELGLPTRLVTGGVRAWSAAGRPLNRG